MPTIQAYCLIHQAIPQQKTSYAPRAALTEEAKPQPIAVIVFRYPQPLVLPEELANSPTSFLTNLPNLSLT